MGLYKKHCASELIEKGNLHKPLNPCTTDKVYMKFTFPDDLSENKYFDIMYRISEILDNEFIEDWIATGSYGNPKKEN